MAVFFYSADFDLERIAGIEKQIKGAMPDLIRIKQINDIVGRYSARPHDTNYLLIVSLTNDNVSFFQIVETVRKAANVFPILISNEISATDYKRLVRSGTAEWVSINAAPQEVLEIISRRLEDVPRVNRPLPVVASFIPCAGGVGNTTLAVEVATLLKVNKPTASRNICIVDLDFQTSHVCDHLDIEARLKIDEISSNPQRLDLQLLDIYVSHHSSGLDVFAAPRTKFDICNLNLSALDAFFNLISGRYDFIIIDFPLSWFTWTPQVVSGSDGIIVTGLNTVPGLRQLAETVGVIRDARHPAAHMALALNRCERGLLGGILHRHHVERVLRGEKVFYIRDEPTALQSVNTGIPMALSRTARKIRGDIASIALFCADLKPVRATERAKAS